MERIHRLWQIVREHRRRVAMLVAVVGVLLVGGRLFEAFPRDVAIEYEVPGHRGVEEVRIVYVLDGEEVVGVRFEEPRSVLSHEVSLSPGRYQIEALVRESGRQRLVRRALRVPAQGVVHIDLAEDHIRLQPGETR